MGEGCEVKCGGPAEAAGSMSCLVSTEVSSFVILRKEVGSEGSQPQATNRAVGSGQCPASLRPR